MVHRHLCTAVGRVLSLFAVAALLLIPGCDEEELLSQGTTVKSPTQTAGSPVKALPKRGKQKLATAPTYAAFGMIYINTKNNREYIYDGSQWVPHDQTVDDYYRSLDSIKARLPASEVFPTGTLPTPTGAHGLPAYVAGGPTQHGKYECKVCHLVGGVLAFDPNGLAVAPGKPLPSFDASTKTCSNVACHGVPAGTFSYYFQGNEMDEEGYPIPDLKTVTIYGNSGGTTPSWYATGTGVGCTACHGNPPANSSDGFFVWHSGFHANNQNVGSIGPNACELCHNKFANNVFSPIAQSSNGIGTAILIPALHGNGVYDVVARFRSQCFNCH